MTLRTQIRDISQTPINDIYYVPPGVSGSFVLSDKKIDQILTVIRVELEAKLPKEIDLEGKRNHTHGRGRQYTKAQGYNQALEEVKLIIKEMK